MMSNSSWTEEERLKALERYKVLDTEREPSFDRLVELAADICDAPVALLSLVDRDRQWFKAEIGLGVRETALTSSVCSLLLRQSGTSVLPDLSADSRTAGNPLVASAPGLRFYAGAHLVTPDGIPLGTLCVLDSRPRPQGLSSRQRRGLEALAAQAMENLEYRRVMLDRAEGERRDAEDRLRDSEERYRLAVEAFQGGVAEYDVRADRAYGSRTFHRLFGDDPETGGRHLRDFFERVHLDARERIRSDFRSLVEGRSPSIDHEYRARHASGRWIDVWTRAVALRDETGATVRVISTTIDVTDRTRAEAALRDSEERLRLATEGAGMGTWDFDLATRRGVWSESAFRTLGYEPTPDRSWTFEMWAERVHPEDLGRARSVVAGAQAGKGSYTNEYRIRRADDGQERWIQSFGRYLYDSAGQPVRFVGVFFDVTERKLYEARLAAEKERLRLALEVGRLATWDWDLATGEVAWNDEHYRMQGYELGEITPSFEAWAARVHPADLETTTGEIFKARDEGGDYVHVFRNLLPDGSVRWCSARGRFFYDEAGRPARMIGVMENVTERRRAQDQERLLLAELQHRVRNTLAVVRGIARRTAENSETVEDFAIHLEGRLGAFARTQAYVTRNPGRGVLLANLMADELAAHRAREGERVSLRGPEIALRPHAADKIGLAVHELATNAVKHGALAAPNGRIDVDWRVDGEGERRMLVFEWTEHLPDGGVVRPERRGFGTDLLQRTLVYELDADVKVDFRPFGLSCSVRLPLANVA